MSNNIEDSKNIVFHVLSEFEIFLDAIILFHEAETVTLKNISLDSLYIHTRSLSDFFSNKSGFPDDLHYSDLVSNNTLCVNLDPEVRKYLNKCLAHISSERVSLTLNNSGFHIAIRDITLSIKSFMDDLDSNITPDYKADLSDIDVIKIRKRIEIKLVTAANYMIK